MPRDLSPSLVASRLPSSPDIVAPFKSDKVGRTALLYGLSQREHLTRQFRSKVDKELHLIEKFGFIESQIGSGYVEDDRDEAEVANRLLGRLVWAHQVAPEWAESRISRLRDLYQQLSDPQQRL